MNTYWLDTIPSEHSMNVLCVFFFFFRCLNISILQSCLSKITLIREKDLDRARRYFEMLYLGFMVWYAVFCIQCLTVDLCMWHCDDDDDDRVVYVDICFGGQLLFRCGILWACCAGLSGLHPTADCVVITSSTGLFYSTGIISII